MLLPVCQAPSNTMASLLYTKVAFAVRLCNLIFVSDNVYLQKFILIMPFVLLVIASFIM